MLGLAVLFGLAVWVAITIGAVFLGAKALKIWWAKPYAGLLGGFLGFMLTMGGFIVYWAVEYIQIQRTVTHLCETKGGVKVYVSPEEFKQRLASNDWDGAPKYKVLPKGDKNNDEYIVFDGKEYKGFRPDKSMPEITIYDYKVHKNNNYPAIYREELYVFNQKKIVLSKNTSVAITSMEVANDLSGLKIWISDIKDCRKDLENDNFDLYDRELNNEW